MTSPDTYSYSLQIIMQGLQLLLVHLLLSQAALSCHLHASSHHLANHVWEWLHNNVGKLYECIAIYMKRSQW